jgi:hypothetical protein
MLTPKLSFRRNMITKAYEKEIESIYQGKAGHKVEY